MLKHNMELTKNTFHLHYPNCGLIPVLQYRKWLTVAQTEHRGVSLPLTHTPKQRPDPDRIIPTHFVFPVSFTFTISVSWPEAEHSLLGVVTTIKPPWWKTKVRWYSKHEVIMTGNNPGLSPLSTFYQCFLWVSFFVWIDVLKFLQPDLLVLADNKKYPWVCLCVRMCTFSCTHAHACLGVL